jgi:hypothetical protein|tara:strand:- start:2478 stop:2672 length:195 start_codon:yes stop_codon:yes gene_type:complete
VNVRSRQRQPLGTRLGIAGGRALLREAVGEVYRRGTTFVIDIARDQDGGRRRSLRTTFARIVVG